MEQPKVLEIKDIIYKYDFTNLISDDIEKIIKDLDLNIPKEIDELDYLYQIKSLIFESQISKKIVTNKIFAGITSVKWYRLDIKDDKDIFRIKSNIESPANFYNDIYEIDSRSLENIRKYTCIKIRDNIYLMRLMVPAGVKTINDGKQIQKMKNVKNVVTIINLDKNYIEIRSSFTDAKRIIQYMCETLSINNYKEVSILDKFSGSIESLKEKLYNGRFVNMLSTPDVNINLSKEQSEQLGYILQILDDYFVSRDLQRFMQELQEIDIETEDMPFTQLLLCGLSKLGIEIRDDIESDLSAQSLYTIFKEYVTTHRGYLEFNYPEDGPKYTIQVGINTNTISFRSSSTEEVISYIRDIILN